MSQPKNSLSDLDRHIKLLEDKVNQLRTSLTVWQKWYLDYSALKEEVEQLSKDPSPREELARIRRDFESDLLTEKEIGEIFGQNDLNEREQIIGVLSRRTDYVEQNIGSLEKLIEAEENKLAAVSIVAYPGADTDEDSGLPITDIIEELDDDDNVVEFRLQSGSDVPIKVLDALKKAGIHDLPETEADLLNNRTLPASGETGQAPEAELASPVPPSVVVTPSPTPAEVDSPSTKKSVSFSQDTKPPNGSDQPPKSMAARKLEEIMQKVKEYEAIDLSKAVIPDNESAEDSELRRQMLQYGMSEIGPVVAELELDDGTPDDEEDEDWDDEDDDEGDDEDDDEDEDELGRSKHSVITSGYIKRMQELEKRLGVKSAFTVEGPESRPRNPDETVAGVGRISVVGTPSSTPGDTPPSAVAKLSKKAKTTKSVKFAPELDIADESVSRASLALGPKEATISPIADVVEKTTTFESPDDAEEEAPKRVSLFKKERIGTKPPVPSIPTLPRGPHQVPAKFLNESRPESPPLPAAPEGQTIADTVVERNVSTQPNGPDDMDDVLLYQAAAVEYNRLRNKMIQKEGGFMKKEEQEIVPLDEEEGGPKRMSKFKAARLAKS